MINIMYLYKYTIKVSELEYSNIIIKTGRDWSLLQKVRKQRIIFWQEIFFKSSIPTFGPLQYVNMIKEWFPKVGIKLLKISHVRILFLVFLLFVAVINPYSVLIFKYSSAIYKVTYYCRATFFQGVKISGIKDFSF